MVEIKKYTVNVPQAKIDRLMRKLDDVEFPAEIEDGGSTYGAPVKDVKSIVDHWRNKFDWRAHEKKLNELPHYEVQIDIEGHGPIDMHFIHQQSEVADAIPLLFVHGWPGSFLEVTKILPLLKAGESTGQPAFHIVAPSLPNYAFSGPALQRGFNVKHYATACHRVMLALGYDQYVTQGGDAGMVITRACALLFPQHVKACHINWAWAAVPAEFADGSEPAPEYSVREKRQMAAAEEWDPVGTGDGRGYIAMHSTRPLTLNYALRDSPVALLAWIWDKLRTWSDDYAWTPDEICLWVSLYVFARAGPEASTYFYYEALHDAVDVPVAVVRGYIDVPLGIADFPVEIANMPGRWRRGLGPVVFERLYEKGGHFAGWERPGDIAEGLGEMFGKGGGAYGVVGGKDGY